MHFDTFIPAFILFAVLGLILPIVLAGMASGSRTSG